MPRHAHPKRSHSAVIMHLEKYICEISEQQDRLEGARFAELGYLETLYRSIAKNLRAIAKEMREVANDKPCSKKKVK